MPHEVIMPALGMAQKTGLIVAWLKQPGEAVKAGEALMEVETDKAVMQVEAQADGYLADVRTAAGEEAPVGDVIALITEAPAPAQRSAEPRPAAPRAAPPSVLPAVAVRPPPPLATPDAGRILASPKAKRLAAERGFDLSRLAAAGIAQPFHAADVESFNPVSAPLAPEGASPRRLAARVRGDGFQRFLDWIGEETGAAPSAEAVLAGLAAAAFRRDALAPALVVAAETFGRRRFYADADRCGLGSAQPGDAEATPALILRDLRMTSIEDLSLGAEEAPVLSLLREGGDLIVKLECAPAQLQPKDAVAVIAAFAGRLEEPLRHLL